MSGTIALSVRNAIKARGTPATLRPVTKVGTPPMPNPPTLINPVVAADRPAGSTSFSINAGSAFGAIVVGDQFALGSQTVTATAQVASRVNTTGNAGFDNIPFTPPLTADVPAGAAVVPIWAADIQTYAKINAYPLSVIYSDTIQLGDLQVKLPAVDGVNPALTYKLIVAGIERMILNLSPSYINGVVVAWDAQAR